jgi:hypothetical protein
MAFIQRAIAILTHPVAFISNLIRTFKLISHRYETTIVRRELDGLEVKMRRPLDPEGIYIYPLSAAFYCPELFRVILTMAPRAIFPLAPTTPIFRIPTSS